MAAPRVPAVAAGDGAHAADRLAGPAAGRSRKPVAEAGQSLHTARDFAAGSLI